MPQGLQLADLTHLAPELTLVISAIVISLLDMFLPRTVSRTLLGWLSLAGVLISAVFVIGQVNPAEPVSLLGQSLRVDDFGSLLKLVLLTGTALVLFMSLGSVREEEIPHVGEYYYLLLPATLGGMVMAASADLITLFVGLELLSITSYILVGMRKKNLQSNEGAFKYIIQGGISSAMILYGMSFLYGMSGSTNLGEINQALIQNASTLSPLIYLSFFLLLAGFGFKVAAAPFHTWAPDVYQGAPTPVTAYLAVVSKAAGFAILFRMMYRVYMGVTNDTGNPAQPISEDIFFSLSVLAAIAMIAGNLLALRQKNVKRLLAYSGIANAGYLLAPISSQFSIVHYTNFSEFLYYLIAYLFMNIGAFAVLMMVERTDGTEELRGFAGFYYRAPWTAVAMVLLILSLAGIPVTGGFFGKIFIMMGTLQNHLYWLASIMIVTSVISFYYYFSIIRQMFMRTDPGGDRLKAPLPLTITAWVCAVAGVALGCYPQGVLRFLQDIFSIGMDMM
ncbi:NADH-quinone oxidoreductase subunit N [Paenibacillus aurantius]|uniref:NADH-quinone oxidoreductase subunit N n=1 Tax=Paenibacillus aurantius TaxID=2918900 RepID=A0AA96LHJ7_9BACL|nr:NADH-quinone oxidoreductase subunit N [Paenibacillus aurantius]WNQ11567.1 NADH-quinone oxidoreductase subunit N [Paenibacillus aurantius]